MSSTAVESEAERIVPAKIDGVLIVNHVTHRDERGSFTEVRRDEWNTGPTPVQWNCSRSVPDVLRGVHVHIRHSDYLMVLDGMMTLMLKDMRRRSPTYNLVEAIELRGDASRAVCIPPGVAHGFHFPVASTILLGVSHYWASDDELGCLWSDPDLGMKWPSKNPGVSKRDGAAGTYKQMLELVDKAFGTLPG